MRTFLVGLLVISLFLVEINGTQIFRSYYDQADQLIEQMSLEEKIGQMTQIDLDMITTRNKTDFQKISDYHMGSVLVGGSGCPTDDGNIQSDPKDFLKATMQNWQKLMVNVNDQPVKVGDTYIGILTGTDAVHGNQHVLGTPLFPHNIGQAATGNSQNLQNQAKWTAQSVLESGFNYIFAPTVAASHNPQWGRFYETQGFDENLIGENAYAFVVNSQFYNSTSNQLDGVLTSTKHFMGDGSTWNGYDDGNAIVYNYTTFYKKNLEGYTRAIEAQTGSVMASYSAINGVGNAMNAGLLIGKLKNEMGFDGFVISDYSEVGKTQSQGLPTTWIKFADTYESTCMLVSGGIDMMMLPGYDRSSLDSYFNDLKKCVAEQTVSIERINDAVRRILAVKISMGLVSKNFSDIKNRNQNKLRILQAQITGNPAIDTLRAAQESLVLLKNAQSTLPLKSSIKNIVLVGDSEFPKLGQTFQNFDNIGGQNGGWTVSWQGSMGNKYWQGALKNQSQATTILDALQKKSSQFQLYYPNYTQESVSTARQQFLSKITSLFSQGTLNAQNTIILGVLSEPPYAEFMGDINCIYCQTTSKTGCLYNPSINEYVPQQQSNTLEMSFDNYSQSVIQSLANVSLVTVLFSGRPRIIQPVLNQSQAFIAAFLPGTSGGQAIVNSIVGDYLFDPSSQKNLLPSDWLSSMKNIQNFPIYQPDGAAPAQVDPLFLKGYGLRTLKKSSIEIAE